MFGILAVVVMAILTWFFAWEWGKHLIEKGYVTDWKTIRADWQLVLLLIVAGSAGANGLLMLIGGALKTISWLALL